MPIRGPVYCGHPGCAAVITYGTGYCEKHKDERRGNRESSSKRGYNSKWQRARKLFLQRPENVFCVECKKEGIYTKATVVDHIVPHRNNKELFWDVNNWQALCKKHHDIKTWTQDATPEYKF